VAVDWGTSSIRCWLMSAAGEALAESRGNEGMLHCINTGFAPVLRDQLARLGDALHEGAIRVDAPGDIRILPGIAQARADRPDVMRGEETQLLGVTEPGFTGLVCIPGTHSKWVTIEAGHVIAFTTYMTGELFSVISQHSILAHTVEAAVPPSADGRPFREGLATALADPARLTASFFRLRAAQLLGFEQRADGAERLSGLLIGTEIADAVHQHGSPQAVRLIGAGSLGRLYETALTAQGFDVTAVDAEQASRGGLGKAAKNIWGAQF
jgi:2-dehydro-3-deoxygalactonokinase